MPDYPNRCQHLKINGTQCGSPALRRNRFCFFHKRFQDERIKLSADRARRGVATFVLPVLEDANSIQIALMQVMRLLVAQQLDHKTASLLLYALQTASTNLRLTNFKPFTNDVILDPRDVANTPLDSHIWDDDDFEEEESEDEDDENEENAKPAAVVTAKGNAVVGPTTALAKKPPSTAEIRQQIREQIRNEFFPGCPTPGSDAG
jgi:hypothetical protein